jgi:alanyl-tRNA synthetase
LFNLTEKLFYNDPYLKECQSEVIDIVNDDNGVLVTLDKTIFYPEGGGQPTHT